MMAKIWQRSYLFICVIIVMIVTANNLQKNINQTN